jgi:hypothetical protein
MACTTPWRLPPSMTRSSSNRPSSASSPRWAAPTHSFTSQPSRGPRHSRPLILLQPRRTEHNIGRASPARGTCRPERDPRELLLPQEEHKTPSTTVRHERETRTTQGEEATGLVRQLHRYARAQGSLSDPHRGAACQADRAGSGPRALQRPPNTGDKLRTGAYRREAAERTRRRLRLAGRRREVRQLHPLVLRPRGSCSSTSAM